MLCEVSGTQVEQALARLHAGDTAAFDALIGLAYDWLGRRVVAVLRDYPRLRLPPDEVLHDRVLDRLRAAVPRSAPLACGELTRLADRHIRWALRDAAREQAGRTAPPIDPDALADPDAAEAVAELV